MSDRPDQGTLDGVHLGAMAGSLDVAQRHFLGVQPELDGLRIYPCVPPALRDLRLCFRYRGALFIARLMDAEVEIRSYADNPDTIRLHHAGGSALLEPGKLLRFPARPVC